MLIRNCVESILDFDHAKPGSSLLRPAGIFFLPRIQYRDCDLPVKQIDQRTHEKCRDDRAYAGDGRYLADLVSGEEEKRAAEDHAHNIRCDTDVFKFPPVPFSRHHDRDRIVGRHSEISGDVQRRAEAQDNYTCDEADDPDHHRRLGDHPLQKSIAELRYIAQEKQIYKCCHADVVAVDDQAEQEQNSIYDYIKCPEADRDQRVKTAHK